LADAFVDTLFVVALVNKKDQDHLRALELASEFEKRSLITTDAVLLKIGNALAKNFRAVCIRVIDDFLTSSEIQIVNLYPDLFQKAFSLYRSHLDKTWGLIDCVSFVVMRDAGVVDSLTTDKHFGQAGFRALLRA
jgi:predicted nucleic acid-binding protein